MKRKSSSQGPNAKHPCWQYTKKDPNNPKQKICIKCLPLLNAGEPHTYSESIAKKSEKVVSHLRGTCIYFKKEENKEELEAMLETFANYQGSNSKKAKLEKLTFHAVSSVLEPKNVNPLNSICSLASVSTSASISSTPNSKMGERKTNVKDSELKQDDIRNHGRRISPEQKQEFERLWARYVYSSGVSFNSCENPALQEAMRKAAPRFEIPSRWKLSNTLLDSEYAHVKKDMVGVIKQHMSEENPSDSVGICLTTDGWSNVHGESIVNFVACTPFAPPVYICSSRTNRTFDFQI
jgi:hypothetical protein